MVKKLLLVVLIMFSCLMPKASYAQSTAPSQDLLEQIDQYVTRQIQQNKIIGGSYAIVYKDQIVATNGIGVSDDKTQAAVTAETIYSTASVTKAFTAAAILHLYEQGKIDLDAPVQRYIPWFSYQDPEQSAKVTIRHLLTHSAGVNRFAADGSIFQNEEQNRDSLENAVRALNTVELINEPGTQGAYCNTCFNILGLVIETVSQKDYEQYLHEELFQPLQLDHTSFSATNAASEYNWVFGQKNKSIPNNFVFGESQNPEGGLYSNVIDLSKFLSAMMGQGEHSYLSRETLEMAHKGQVSTGSENTFYALSGFEETIHNNTRLLYKGGDGIGSTAMIMLIPDQEIGIAFLVGESLPELSGPLVQGIVAILQGQTPEEVRISASFWQVIGYIALGFSIIGLIQLILLARSLMSIKYTRKPATWWLICRSILCAIIALPLAYLMLTVRPTQIAFYGYPYDLAIGMIALIVPNLLWLLYSIALLFTGTAQTVRTSTSA